MELSIAYALTGPDGTRAVLGNGDAAKLDPDWVGFLDPANGITGLLDGPEERPNQTELVEADGGEFGPGYASMRPGTIQGVIDPNATVTTQELKIAKLKRASRARRADAILRWTPTTDGIERMLRLRRTGRGSFPGRIPKTFQLAMTSPDAFVKAAVESSLEITPAGNAGELGIADPITDPITSPLNVAGAQFVVNAGDVDTWPRFRIDGPITNPEIINFTTGQTIKLTYVLNAGEWLDVYPERGVILLGGTADRYGAYDFALSEWWQLQPGNNDVRLLAAAFGAGAKVTVFWRHAWE